MQTVGQCKLDLDLHMPKSFPIQFVFPSSEAEDVVEPPASLVALVITVTGKFWEGADNVNGIGWVPFCCMLSSILLLGTLGSGKCSSKSSTRMKLADGGGAVVAMLNRLSTNDNGSSE